MSARPLPKIVTVGLVPATQTRRRRQARHGSAATINHQTSALLDGRDKPGHDEQEGWR